MWRSKALMCCLVFFTAVLLFSQTSCSFSSKPKKIQSGMEIENENFSEAKENETVSDFEKQPIICRIRHCLTDTFVRSDLIFQEDGRVYCGFYLMNESVFKENNEFIGSDGEVNKDFRFMDDDWLESCINDEPDDDFMLFGEMFELGTMPDAELEKLTELIGSIDLNSCFSTEDNIETQDKNDCYYTDFVVSDNGTSSVLRAFAELPSYSFAIDDSSAIQAYDIVMNQDSDFFQKWEELCEVRLNVKY